MHTHGVYVRGLTDGGARDPIDDPDATDEKCISFIAGAQQQQAGLPDKRLACFFLHCRCLAWQC